MSAIGVPIPSLASAASNESMRKTWRRRGEREGDVEGHHGAEMVVKVGIGNRPPSMVWLGLFAGLASGSR